MALVDNQTVMSHGKRSIALITALLAVLLALGIPAAASSAHSNSSSSSDRTSQNDSRDESDADHDRGYGNDDREDKAKDNEKAKDNGVEDATSEPVLDPQIDADATLNPEPASDLDESVDDETIDDEVVQEELVDEETVDEETEIEETEIDAPDNSTDPSEVATTDNESMAEGLLDESDTTDIVVPETTDDTAADEDESELPTNGSTNPLDALEVNSVDEIISVEMAAEEVLTDSSLDAAAEEPTQSVTEAGDLPEAAGEAGASSEKPSDAAQAEKSTSKPDRDESASDHDKGYGNDDKDPKTKEDQAPDTTPADVAAPDETPVPGPVEVDMTENPAPFSAVEPVQFPDAVTTQPVEAIEAVDPGPEVTALLASEKVRITRAAPALSTAESAPPSAGSVLAPLGRLLLPPAGLALVDLLSDTDAPTLIGSNRESVAEAAQQAAGLVAVPAALTALALLGWALKPAAIKASAGVAGRNG